LPRFLCVSFDGDVVFESKPKNGCFFVLLSIPDVGTGRITKIVQYKMILKMGGTGGKMRVRGDADGTPRG